MSDPTPSNEPIQFPVRPVAETQITPPGTERPVSNSEETQIIDLAEVRRKLTQETRQYDRSLVEQAEKQHTANTVDQESNQPKQESRKVPKKLYPLLLGALALETLKRAPLFISQLGAIHPWRSNGNWHYVVEPWARINDDPNQPAQGDNAYLDKFGELKKQGVKTLDETNLPEGKLPALRVMTGGLNVQYLDHNRIKAAQANGMRIAVDLYPSKVESFS